MKERPILFSGPMVRAILDGRKTQTRRVVKSPDPCCYDPRPIREDFEEGMRLWVRETLSVVSNWGTIHYTADDAVLYDPDFIKVGFPYCDEANAIVERYGDSYHANDIKHVPAIFMPRWASRITLETVAVRVERVQDITEEDATAEGVNIEDALKLRGRFREAFSVLWDSINLKRGFGWQQNPWVWAISFKRIGG